MKKYNVAVYAICKNEEQFVDRWFESMSEADAIYVLDTGSTDNTVKKFEALGVNVVVEKIVPWRFDKARNKSLDLVPANVDICVSTDIDEFFKPGWRETLESVWSPFTKQLRFRYTWNFNPDGSEGSVFMRDKIHTRKDFLWVNPVHEVLKYTGSEPYVVTDSKDIQLNHHADDTKSRAQYLELLELAVEEDPTNDRNMHYLGREYMFRGEWEKCIATLKRHLDLETATWKDERCASMRFIAKAYKNLSLQEEEQKWIYRAIAEAPHLREPWLQASAYSANNKDWLGSLYFAQKALSITERSDSYINESESWNEYPYDLAAVSAYYCGFYKKALIYGEAALSFNPGSKRLNDNSEFYKKAIKPEEEEENQ